MKVPAVRELTCFKLESYKNLLQYLNKTYKVVPFCEIPQKDVPYLILRHDVDFSLPAALKMALLEKGLGIRSTYFVLFSSKFYNVFEGNNVDILKQISKLGHEIGLHYHPAQYQIYRRNPKKILNDEIRLLEHLLGKKVYSIARHGPWDRDPFATIKEYINANHPRLRRDIFIHDSCRAWTPLEGLLKLLHDPPKRVQLLIHPGNWQEDEINRETLLKRFIQSLEEEVNTLEENIKRTWLTDPLVREYDSLVKKGDFLQLHKNGYPSDSKTRNRIQKALNYYNKQIRWFLINTSLGWRIHKILTKIRGNPRAIQ